MIISFFDGDLTSPISRIIVICSFWEKIIYIATQKFVLNCWHIILSRIWHESRCSVSTVIKTYRDVFHYLAVGYISIVIIHSMNEKKIGSGNSLSCTGISWKFLLIFSVFPGSFRVSFMSNSRSGKYFLNFNLACTTPPSARGGCNCK